MNENKSWARFGLIGIASVLFLGVLAKNDTVRGILLGAGGSSANREIAWSLKMNSQMAHDIVRSVEATLTAKSWEDWYYSGYTPHQIYSNLRAFKSSRSKHAACRSFSSLKDSELALFENEITWWVNRDVLPCRDQLVGRLALHWDAQREEILGKLPQLKKDLKIPATSIRIIKPGDAPYVASNSLARGEISLVFIMGQKPDATQEVLQILKKLKLRAMFVVTGIYAETKPLLIQKILKQKHQIAFAGWRVENYSKMDQGFAERRLRRSQLAVSKASGFDQLFFHHAFGNIPQAIQRFLARRKVTTIAPSLDLQDWKVTEVVPLYERFKSHIELHGRAIIRLSDYRPQTRMILPHLIQLIGETELTPVVFEAREDKMMFSKL